MAQRTVRLTLANRQVLANLLSLNRDGSVLAARHVREARRALRLREATERVAEIEEQLRQELQAARDDGQPARRVDVWDEVAQDSTVEEYQIDEAYLVWLRDKLDRHDWGKVQTQDGKEVTITVDPAMLEQVAETADALAAALALRTG